jgi:hypothetical protein
VILVTVAFFCLFVIFNILSLSVVWSWFLLDLVDLVFGDSFKFFDVSLSMNIGPFLMPLASHLVNCLAGFVHTLPKDGRRHRGKSNFYEAEDR